MTILACVSAAIDVVAPFSVGAHPFPYWPVGRLFAPLSTVGAHLARIFDAEILKNF